MTTGNARTPETMALFRLLSQKRLWVRGRIAMHSKRRQKKDTVQNGSIDPKVSITNIPELLSLMTSEMAHPLSTGDDHVGGKPEEKPMPHDAGAPAQLQCQ